MHGTLKVRFFDPLLVTPSGHWIWYIFYTWHLLYFWWIPAQSDVFCVVR